MNGIVTTGKWALCQDEKTIIYDGKGAGNFCPMPFLYNRQFYETCTKKSSTQQLGFETYFWCPDPSSVNISQQNLFLSGGRIGKCNNFLIPEGDVMCGQFSLFFTIFSIHSDILFCHSNFPAPSLACTEI